jgi:hypothetical protein
VRCVGPQRRPHGTSATMMTAMGARPVRPDVQQSAHGVRVVVRRGGRTRGSAGGTGPGVHLSLLLKWDVSTSRTGGVGVGVRFGRLTVMD